MEAVVWSEWSEKLELHGCVFGLLPVFVAAEPLFSELVFGGFETSLVCIQKKPSFDVKEALFGVERSLVFKKEKSRRTRKVKCYW